MFSTFSMSTTAKEDNLGKSWSSYDWVPVLDAQKWTSQIGSDFSWWLQTNWVDSYTDGFIMDKPTFQGKVNHQIGKNWGPKWLGSFEFLTLDMKKNTWPQKETVWPQLPLESVKFTSKNIHISFMFNQLHMFDPNWSHMFHDFSWFLVALKWFSFALVPAFFKWRASLSPDTGGTAPRWVEVWFPPEATPRRRRRWWKPSMPCCWV